MERELLANMNDLDARDVSGPLGTDLMARPVVLYLTDASPQEDVRAISRR